MMKIGLHLLLLIGLLTITLGSCRTKYIPEENMNVNFHDEMVKTLGLTFVNKDSIYLGAQTKIFNDTIVGYNGYFYIQSLVNPSYIKKNKVNDIHWPVHIDQFKDGCMYFGDFSRPNMICVCSDGKVKRYFEKNGKSMFYARKVMIYKEKTIVISMDAIYIYNTETEELIWKYKFSEAVELIWSSQINGKLVFLECPDSKPDRRLGLIHCLDLDKLYFAWQISLKNECGMGAGSGSFQEFEYIPHNDKEIFVRTRSGIGIYNIRNGNLVFKHKDVFHFEYDYDLEVYYGLTRNGLICFDKDFKEKWQIRNGNFAGVYKQFVVLSTLDKKYYAIVSKSDGRLVRRIRLNFSDALVTNHFLDKYVVLNGMYIYR